MTTLDDFFKAPVDSFSHTRLRHWKAFLERPNTKAEVEVFRPEALLGQAQPEMYVKFTEGHNPPTLEEMLWDDDLNEGLIALGVRATDLEQEAIRFALGLRAAMRKAEREARDGYFNSVFVKLIKDSDLTQYSEIAGVLKHIHVNEPHQGKSYAIIREMIADAISRRARELTDSLHYSEEDAKKILVSALATYLDQRFSVSNRRRLGML